MGACNSAQAGLEQRCGRQIRRNRKERRTGSSSSSSSSNSSSSLTLANNKPSLDKSISSNAVGGEKLQQQQPSPERPPRGLVRDGERVKKGVDKEETVSKQQQDLRRKSSGSNHRISGNILGSKLEDDTKTTTHSEEGLKAKTEEEKNKRQERGGKEEIGEEKKRSKLDVLKEGVDFIETEEDVEAVESAVVKIQSTFRGKKIRSKLGGGQKADTKQEGTATSKTTTTTTSKPSEATPQPQAKSLDSSSKEGSVQKTAAATKQVSTDSNEELNKRVANMQVNDNSHGTNKQEAHVNASPVKNLPEEAERAATKIQAGFKGYKTRKELEGKLSGQQGAPQAASGSENEALQETGTIRGGGGGGGGGGDK